MEGISEEKLKIITPFMYEIIVKAIHTLRNYRFADKRIEEFLKEMEKKHFYGEKFEGKYI